MKFTLEKMSTKHEETIQYFLPKQTEQVCVNDFIGKEIQLHWTGVITCRTCAKKTKKSFGEGFCYSCFSNAAEAITLLYVVQNLQRRVLDLEKRRA